MAIKQDVNAPLIVTIGVVSGLLLLVIMFGTQAWFVREERDEIAQKWEAAPNTQLEELRKAQRARIETSGTVEGRHTMPIQKAMKFVIDNGGKLPATQPAAGQKRQ
jgi:hypothetical protein